MERRSATELESLLAKIAVMDRDQLRALSADFEDERKKDGTRAGHDYYRRIIATIDAVGELKFPGEWNPFDKVVA